MSARTRTTYVRVEAGRRGPEKSRALGYSTGHRQMRKRRGDLDGMDGSFRGIGRPDPDPAERQRRALRAALPDGEVLWATTHCVDRFWERVATGQTTFRGARDALSASLSPRTVAGCIAHNGWKTSSKARFAGWRWATTSSCSSSTGPPGRASLAAAGVVVGAADAADGLRFDASDQARIGSANGPSILTTHWSRAVSTGSIGHSIGHSRRSVAHFRSRLRAPEQRKNRL